LFKPSIPQSLNRSFAESNPIKRVGSDWYMVCIQRIMEKSVTEGPKLPARGEKTLPDLVGTSTDGRNVHVSDFHGRRNLVLVFSGAQSHHRSQELICD
jgi:hypothetical protein